MEQIKIDMRLVVEAEASLDRYWWWG